MIAIFKREFKAYFINVSGYVFLAALWVFSGIFSTALNFIGQSASYEYALSYMLLFLLLTIPILTMRSMSEDRRNKTDMLLYSLPVSSVQVVLGKYFAMLAVWAVACLGMGVTPIIIGMYGAVNFASAYSALFGFFLLGAALIAVCTFISSLTENQLIAAIGGIVSSFALYLLGSLVGLIPASALASFACFAVLAIALAVIVYFLTKNYVIAAIVAVVTLVPTVVLYIVNSELFASAFPRMLEYLALFDRYYTFLGGIFDVGAVVYYISFAVFFIFLTVQSFDKRRWS